MRTKPAEPRAAAPSFSRSAFARAYLLPLLWLFAAPLFSAWFFGHAATRYDRPYVERLEELAQQGKMDARSLDYWRTHPPSRLCAERDPRLAKSTAKLPCGSYRQFAWGRRIAWGALGLGVVGVLLMGVFVGLSLLSQRAQYISFRLGWLMLKLISMVQVLAQGLLLVGLSYWVTALWFHIYVPKLIFLVGFFALVAAGLMVKSIFVRMPKSSAVLMGRLLKRSQAPELWRHLDALADTLGTAPPEHVVVGTDANFFVSEYPLRLEQQRLGRTLYLSLPLLATLERDEASAVLAHEMAHFSGDDTLYSRKLAPLLDRFSAYLEALHAGGISLPVFYFMLAYWSLFQLSLSRTSKQREFRADALGAAQTSAEAAGRALLKIAAYCSFRDKVEAEAVQADALQPDLRVGDKLAQGFVGYVESPELDELFEADPSNFGHPFDSHPPLSARLAALGSMLVPEDYRAIVTAGAESSWISAIVEGEALQAALWQEHEARLADLQQTLLAYRIQPDSDEHRAIIEKHFPPQTFPPKKRGGTSITLDLERLHSSDGQVDVRLAQIVSAGIMEKSFRGRFLQLNRADGHSHEIQLNRLEEGGQPFLEAFDRYLGRYYAAEQHRNATAEGSESPLP